MHCMNITIPRIRYVYSYRLSAIISYLFPFHGYMLRFIEFHWSMNYIIMILVSLQSGDTSAHLRVTGNSEQVLPCPTHSTPITTPLRFDQPDTTTVVCKPEEKVKEAEKRRDAEVVSVMKESGRRAIEAEKRVDEFESHWVVDRSEIHIKSQSLGAGSFGKVFVAEFRGIKVAAKLFHPLIISSYHRQLFRREINMAARVRHPNLVQFIGASMGENMVMLTELMSTSLRKKLEKDREISPDHITSISLDVTKALNYLHMMQPDPIIHRDISSSNVLLDPLPDNNWKAKVADFTTVNFQRQLNTAYPGSLTYSAPEASDPSCQSSKMDIYSFGVLLVEMCTVQFPVLSARKRLIASIKDEEWVRLIRQCTHSNINLRPSAAEIIDLLSSREPKL